MPRIDPAQLLKCLSVLLTPDGGIKSQDEVLRLSSLMTKFSKKLVSKCIYVQILKRTETKLLGSFMEAGGWTLAHSWLTDAILAKNWPLIEELLELLLLCPVDVQLLKANNCPKLVKELSKESNPLVIHTLASKLVNQWLALVKIEVAPALVVAEPPSVPVAEPLSVAATAEEDVKTVIIIDSSQDTSTIEEVSLVNNSEVDNTDGEVKTSTSDVQSESETDNGQIPILKITVKDGKQTVTKVEDKNDKRRGDSDKKHSEKRRHSKESDSSKKRDSDKGKSSSSSRSSSSKSSSSSSKYSSSKSSSSDRHKSSSSSKSSKDKDKDSSKSSSSSKSKDRHRSSSSSKSSHGDKERTKEQANQDKITLQNEKNKDTLNKLQTPSLSKLGKIPKKSSSSSEKSDVPKEKPSISIEVRKPNDPNRPKTVKMFNSRFRSHGLEEEAKPPLPRGSMKKPSTATVLPVIPTIPPKRSSPIHSSEAPPEKKQKIYSSLEQLDKPGAIKLIPAKPKPAVLLESDMFMDALTASATTNKKEPRKKKRRMSGSKDTPTGDTSPPTSPPPQTPPAQISSPPAVTATVPNDKTPQEEPTEASKPTFKFYQELANEDEEKEKNRMKSPLEDSEMAAEPVVRKSYASPPQNKDKTSDDEKKSGPKELKGVLCVHKKKGPKKTLRWRDHDLLEYQYFELDETERINVTKTFSDMKQMERVNEREQFIKSRNIPANDLMKEEITWYRLIPLDDVPVFEYGKNSKEKDIQIAREKSVLQSLYFNKAMIPDTAAEADSETHPTTDPVIVPLDDVTGNPDTINDFQNHPWPEPKVANESMVTPGINGMPMQPMFPQIPAYGPGFNNPQFMGGFPPGAMMPGEWPVGGPGMMNMPQGMMPPDGMNVPQEMFMGPRSMPAVPNAMFPGQMGGEYPMMDTNMNGPFPTGFPGPMGGPQGLMVPGGPPGPFGFNGNRGGGNMRGQGVRGAANSNWRGKGAGWNGPPRGGSNHRGNTRLCSHFQKKGFCRQGDQCLFLHPGVNCPPF